MTETRKQEVKGKQGQGLKLRLPLGKLTMHPAPGQPPAQSVACHRRSGACSLGPTCPCLHTALQVSIWMFPKPPVLKEGQVTEL